MSSFTVSILAVLAVLAALIFLAVSTYNRLVSLRNRFRNAFSQIDVQLKRRYDLVPNLVATAKAYLKHERETLEAVIAARNQAASANNVAAADPSNAQAFQQMMVAEGALTSGLGKLFALAENYPELKADAQMAQLSEELSSTENRIAFARQAYNDDVMEYNNAIEHFPSSIIAGLCAFNAATLLQATESAEERKTLRVAI